MSARWVELHRESEWVASQAQLCLDDDPDHAAALYGNAAEAEEQALQAIEKGSLERSASSR